MEDRRDLPSPPPSPTGSGSEELPVPGPRSPAPGSRLPAPSPQPAGVTVWEVLRVVLPSGATAVAGAHALGRRVTWATQLRSRPPAFETSDGGEFVLAPAATLASLRVFDESLTLERLVEGLSSAGAAALAVMGELAAPELEAARRAADHTSLPLIRVPAAQLVDLERAIIGLIFNRRAELQQRATQVFRRLTQLSMEGQGLAAILSETARVTGRAVAYEDAGFRLLAVASPEALAGAGGSPPASPAAGGGTEPYPNGSAPAALSSIEERAQLNRWVRGQVLDATTPPALLLSAARWHVWRFVAPVVTRDRVRGFLSLCGPETELTELDQLLASRAAAAGALELAKEDAVLAAEQRVQGELADELLAGGWADPEGVARRAQLLGISPDAHFAVLVLGVDRSPGGVAAGTRGHGDTADGDAGTRRHGDTARDSQAVVSASPRLRVSASPVASPLPTAGEARERARDGLAREVRTSVPAALFRSDEELFTVILPVRAAPRPPVPAPAHVGGQRSVVSGQESVVSGEPDVLTTDHRPLTTGHGPPATSPTADPAGEWLLAQARALQAAALGGVGGHAVSVGISGAHAGLAGIAAAGREARDALRIGRQVFGPGHCTSFSELGVYRLLFPLRGSTELRRFYEETLGALEEYDRRTGLGLVETLEAFFACHGNLSRTAKLLKFHRNSLLYHIKRAQEIGGFDLEDAEVRLALQVALKIRRLFLEE